MPGGQLDFAADDRRLLPGDARGAAFDGDFRARRPERDAFEGDDPYALPGRRSSFADAGPGTAGAEFSSARVERALAAADRAPRSGATTPAVAPMIDAPDEAVAGAAFDPLTLLRNDPAPGTGGDDISSAPSRSTRLHPLFMRGMGRSDQGPRLGERPRRHIGDGLASPDPMTVAAGRASQRLADSDLDFLGMSAPPEGQSTPDPQARLLREQARIPMYQARPSFDDRDITESDAAHPLFAAHEESPSTYGAPAMHPAPASADLYEVPGRRASFLDNQSRAGSKGSPAPATRPPAPATQARPGEGRAMSMSSDDDFDPEWMNGKIPDSYYDSLGLPLGGHYMDTRRHQEWNRRAAARPKPQPKRAWWKKLGSFLTGRGWR